jgi:hypothetical protein
MLRGLVTLACLGSAAAVAVAGRQHEVSTRTLVDRAAGYVAQYQQQLTRVVADERYAQDILEQRPPDPAMPRTRVLRSEVFFMFAPGRGDWMAIRDVMAVDGQALTDRPDVRQALRTLPARDVAAMLKAHNSRFNIGRTLRNFNEATLSLLVLDDEHRHRFAFDRRRVERAADGSFVATLTFRERERPTLIRDVKHGQVFSRGELTVDVETGHVRRAVLTATIGPRRLELTTLYAPEPRLAIWVPERFREGYEHRDRREYERIVCEATYTNYRRFETSVRIK